MTKKNTTTSRPEFKTWDAYVEEAAIEPFVLKVSPDETLTFTAPTGVSLMRVSQGLRSGDLELCITAVTGDQWPRMRELLDGASHKALPALLEDMMDHFELYEDVVLVSPTGDRVTRRRPTEIRPLLDAGYRPAGEAPASS